MNGLDKRLINRLLTQVYLFKDLSDDELDQLATVVVRKHIAPKREIVHKGERGPEMFALVSGCVAVTTCSEEGKEFLFDILSDGEFFGEISLLDGAERTATVTALEPCEILILERDRLLNFIKSMPDIAVKMLCAMAARLRHTDRFFEDTVFCQLPERLARKFLSLAVGFGLATEAGLKIDLKLSQQQIGKMTNASRESVNKQMRVWMDEGAIQFENGYLTIKRVRYLENLSTKKLSAPTEMRGGDLGETSRNVKGTTAAINRHSTSMNFDTEQDARGS